MSKLLRMPESLKGKGVHGYFEDWESNFVTGDRWTPLTTDSSSASTLIIVNKTAAGGVLEITQDATDNDEIYFIPTVESFLIAADKPLYYEARIKYAEGDTNKNNVILGWISTGAANTIIDDGGGPVASATMAVVFKNDGETVWRMRSQIGAAVGITSSLSTNTAGGTAYQVIGVEILPYSSTKAKVVYTIDGNPFYDANNKAITHDLTYTNAVAMGPIVGVKNGSGTAEVMNCDYVAAYQVR